MDKRLKSLRRLVGVMDEREAQAIVRLLFESLFGMSNTDMLSGGSERLSESDAIMLDECVERIYRGEPVQYVLGTTDFMGLNLSVNPSVLIPRPETEDLVRFVIEKLSRRNNLKVLDIGTGSGCIALALKHAIPYSKVYGWDISQEALEVAKENAATLGLDVKFEQRDILASNNISEIQHDGGFDVIVSNPPYVCNSEAADMERHVLEYEPNSALFVPDDSPLLFYDPITHFAWESLSIGGNLFFEVNRMYAHQVCELMFETGFTDVAVVQDRYGNERIVSGLKQ